VKVIVPVKRVPDTAGEKNIDPNDKTVDRESVESVLCPVNEFAIEEAVRLKENQGAEVKVLLMGPESAQPIVRKALSYGLDSALQITDDALAGSDAIGTARAIAQALEGEEFDLLIFGNQSTDARTCVVPAAVAEILGLPSLTYARHLEVDGDKVVVHREHEEGWDVVESSLPAIVSWSRRSTSRATPRSRGSWPPSPSRWTSSPPPTSASTPARSGRPTLPPC
jgi:electron transfer flavoprotein beta subunit